MPSRARSAPVAHDRKPIIERGSEVLIEYSVVIPTFNRMDTLPEVLDALEAQADAPPFEIIVVDDGSTDSTGEFLERRLAERTPSAVPLAVLHQENAGPALARNRGVEAARGARVAFLGDDTVPSSGWLREHHRAFEEHPDEEILGVVGYTGWHPRMRLDPFLRYINEYGLQFGYSLIENPDDLPFNFLYTSNLTLPRQALLDEPFDLSFPYAAWEDTELSYRLEKRGMRLIYRASAEVAHDHPTTLGRFEQRQEKAGYSAVVFYGLHPELGSFLGLGPEGPPPRVLGARRRWTGRLARILLFFGVKTPALWEEILRSYYIDGLHRGWVERAVARPPGD